MGHLCSLLATVALAEYADCVLPIENQALLDILRSPLPPSFLSNPAKQSAWTRKRFHITCFTVSGKQLEFVSCLFLLSSIFTMCMSNCLEQDYFTARKRTQEGSTALQKEK